MINFIIAYDDNEEENLSFFFKSCAINLIEKLNINFHTYAEWTYSNKYLDYYYVDHFLSMHIEDPFVFIGYSHGDEDSLLVSNQPYLSTKSILGAFTNSLFYTFSCSSGKLLGFNLSQLGCKCFVGYKREVYFVVPYLSQFVECSNAGIYALLSGSNVDESLVNMREVYNLKIDEMYEENYVAASTLRDNRDALIHYGDKNLYISDFGVLTL